MKAVQRAVVVRVANQAGVVVKMETKICSKCGVEKDINEYAIDKSRRDGYSYVCKTCIKINSNKWYINNKETHCNKVKEFYLKYPEKNRQRGLNYRLKYPEKVKERGKKNYLKDKNKIIQRTIKRHKLLYKTDLGFRILTDCRGMLSRALNGNHKNNRTMKYFMCSVVELISHIEKKFQPGMNWHNRGNGPGKWNIDHIIPCSFFQPYTSNEVEIYMCCRYQNLQPLWWEENSAKGDKVPYAA